MNSNYEEKYLKYKSKYLELKEKLKQKGGNDEISNIISKLLEDGSLTKSDDAFGSIFDFYNLTVQTNKKYFNALVELTALPVIDSDDKVNKQVNLLQKMLMKHCIKEYATGKMMLTIFDEILESLPNIYGPDLESLIKDINNPKKEMTGGQGFAFAMAVSQLFAFSVIFISSFSNSTQQDYQENTNLDDDNSKGMISVPVYNFIQEFENKPQLMQKINVSNKVTKFRDEQVFSFLYKLIGQDLVANYIKDFNAKFNEFAREAETQCVNLITDAYKAGVFQKLEQGENLIVALQDVEKKISQDKSWFSWGSSVKSNINLNQIQQNYVFTQYKIMCSFGYHLDLKFDPADNSVVLVGDVIHYDDLFALHNLIETSIKANPKYSSSSSNEFVSIAQKFEVLKQIPQQITQGVIDLQTNVVSRNNLDDMFKLLQKQIEKLNSQVELVGTENPVDFQKNITKARGDIKIAQDQSKLVDIQISAEDAKLKVAKQNLQLHNISRDIKQIDQQISNDNAQEFANGFGIFVKNYFSTPILSVLGDGLLGPTLDKVTGLLGDNVFGGLTKTITGKVNNFFGFIIVASVLILYYAGSVGATAVIGGISGISGGIFNISKNLFGWILNGVLHIISWKSKENIQINQSYQISDAEKNETPVNNQDQKPQILDTSTDSTDSNNSSKQLNSVKIVDSNAKQTIVPIKNSYSQESNSVKAKAPYSYKSNKRSSTFLDNIIKGTKAFSHK